MIQTFVFTGISVCSITNISCKISAEGIKLLNGDYQSPVLEYYNVVDEKTINLKFSKEVSLCGCSVSSQMNENKEDEQIPENDLIEAEISYDDSKTLISLNLAKELIVGKTYELFGMVNDDYGNSLTFSVQIPGYNSRIPKIIMTEIQSASVGQTTKEKAAGIYRNEFIEFLALSDGNLSGLEIVSGYDGESKKYIFPPVEVKKGEIFVVHLRKRGQGCISEEGDNLNLAFASYTNPDVRDLWGSEESTLLGNKVDVVVVKNQFTGKVVDAVMYRESSVESWSKDMEKYAILAVDSTIYDSSNPDQAAITDGLTDTKTFSRQNCNLLIEKIEKSEEIEYPVKGSLWEVTSASAGSIQ